MSLWARLMFIEEPPIPHVPFIGVVQEWRRGALTATQAANIIGLSAAERQQAQDLIARFDGGFITLPEFHYVTALASYRRYGSNANLYPTEASYKTRLGVP